MLFLDSREAFKPHFCECFVLSLLTLYFYKERGKKVSARKAYQTQRSQTASPGPQEPARAYNLTHLLSHNQRKGALRWGGELPSATLPVLKRWRRFCVPAWQAQQGEGVGELVGTKHERTTERKKGRLPPCASRSVGASE